MSLLRVNKDVHLLLDQLLGVTINAIALRSSRFLAGIGREYGQLAALRLGDPGFCACDVVMQDGLSADKGLRGLGLIIRQGGEVRNSGRRPDCGWQHCQLVFETKVDVVDVLEGSPRQLERN